MKKLKILSFFILITFLLQSCNGKLPGGDARKFPADPKKRVEQNLSEGKGFRLSGEDGFFGGKKGGVFEFASSNELWRASLDVLDFMPLSSVNYSGGIIITDWYNNNNNPEESIKISIRFLTNEIRSDSLNVKVYTKNCETLNKCTINEDNPEIKNKLITTILAKASKYKQDKNKKND